MAEGIGTEQRARRSIVQSLGRQSEVRVKTQYGVLAYYVTEEAEPRFLLITSRDTGRWVIPRGNPIPRLSPRQSAIQEAYEEAGITGLAGKNEIGRYSYLKRRKKKSGDPAEVRVYPLQVTAQSRRWPERRQRRTEWFTREAAAEAVDEPGLKALILEFAPPPDAGKRAPPPAVGAHAKAGAK